MIRMSLLSSHGHRTGVFSIVRKRNPLQIFPRQSALHNVIDSSSNTSTVIYRRDYLVSIAMLMAQGFGIEEAIAGESPFSSGKSGIDRVVAIKETDQIVANGIVWDDEGHIVSSYITFKDVLRKNTELKATINSEGMSCVLTAVGFDPTLDIIVFKCDKALTKQPLRLVTKGYRIGSTVFSVVRDIEADDGCYIGKGIISGLDRTIIAANGVKMPNLLQTDAPISIFSAGSGLFQPDGALIGIFTPGNIPYSKFRSDSGVNFIIPGSTLKTVVPKLLKQ